MSYWVRVIGEITHPANAPRPALSPNESVRMFAMLMPASIAASGLDEQARIARPGSVCLRNTCNATTMTAMVPNTQRTCGEIAAPEESNGGDLVAGEIG